ncbi:unnamed protein product [Phytophthora fragariaefolia]|uniref:Unnamed protein product n=1 Tax=Phytophthora fragariaefolia TaxID=1490495 RepID=A0A9W6UEF3_9STRA|nr:unnamed protein product [Phytophthora fragariaefolia]
MFAELPEDADIVSEVQQCRYFKRGMPRAWQDKLAAAGVVHDRLNELVLYFTRIEKAEQRLATQDKGRRNNESRRHNGSGRNHSSGRNNDHRKETQKPQHRVEKKKDQGSNARTSKTGGARSTRRNLLSWPLELVMSPKRILPRNGQSSSCCSPI